MNYTNSTEARTWELSLTAIQ